MPDGTLGGKVHNNLSSAGSLQLQVDIFCSDILETDPRHSKLSTRLKIYEGASKEGPEKFVIGSDTCS